MLLAIDDSRSMAEARAERICDASVAMLCGAMSRLEVGALGLVSFGGTKGVTTLHTLGDPFDENAGVKVASALGFDQDATVQQQPMMDVVAKGLAMLEAGRNEIPGPTNTGAGGGGGGGGGEGGAAPHQLFLIVADGRINEGRGMRSLVHDAMASSAAGGGLLIVFIVLDTEANSLLDVKTVEFVEGKPVMKGYMESFPFPLYIVLRELASLPNTLADLIRQWVEHTMLAGGG